MLVFIAVVKHFNLSIIAKERKKNVFFYSVVLCSLMIWCEDIWWLSTRAHIRIQSTYQSDILLYLKKQKSDFMQSTQYSAVS